MEQIKALYWPWDLRALSSTQQMFADLPFVGVYGKTWRQLRQQLARRPEDVSDSWAADEELAAVRGIVGGILVKCLSWPNSRFIPEDACEILFWSPWIGCDTVVAWQAIEERFGISFTEDDLANMCGTFNYGELIALIRERG
ncbi:hypothetical protein ACFL34_02170 [Candidatus Sumerlaeota bacterium]